MSDINSIFPNNLTPREFFGKEQGGCAIEVYGKAISHHVNSELLATYDNPIGFAYTKPNCHIPLMATFAVMDLDIHDDYIQDVAKHGRKFHKLHGREFSFDDFYETLSDYDRTRTKSVRMPTLFSIN